MESRAPAAGTPALAPAAVDLRPATSATSSAWGDPSAPAPAAVERPRRCPAFSPAREVALEAAAIAPARAAAGLNAPGEEVGLAAEAVESVPPGEAATDLAAERAPAKAAGEFNDPAIDPAAAV